MRTFINDFKYEWSKSGNSLVKIITINVLVFVFIQLFQFFTYISSTTWVFEVFFNYITLPSSFGEFIYQPWSIFTYFVSHYELLHILFNMLGLYWFGLIFTDLVGSRKLTALYIFGGLAGGLSYILIMQFSSLQSSGLIGASASIYAITVGAATLAPDFRLNLLFFGPVKIKYIALAYVFLSFIGSSGLSGNAGGNIAHLGGALVGYLFVRSLQNGNDWSKPFYIAIDSIEGIFKPKPKLRVTYQKQTVTQGYGSTRVKQNNTNANQYPNQKEIDAILDKISEQGYEKLSTEEKQLLFKASQKNTDIN